MDPSIAPASRAAAATPNDSAIVGACALHIGMTGDVAIAPRRDMDPVVFRNVPAGTILPVHAAIVALTGTTASNIIALF
ncbi:hypothetical protein GGE16_000876 [Rhizobium leguminosarum]|uniref:Uncharacterized protein n=1 Tax=Rhizobium leguminosarum TaxID=384 RepID=A0AAE2MGG5_RHILE|nr:MULTISPECIES: hypothetical protein [Rhizobium]MBB4288860.1 hypothetical protein [Rhizobium leguminosarum]MBB4295046.1 hypothetical protein [Rhizobium leguminosarum]MBB4306440.1 hypothetical protein [Rhizobium leguminosarum]MBB4417980.1 hypothetical protein [Rhizobium leguminosarum]MBB4432825.1 hypothetical protein [Rhizobium esperanzae]